MTIYGYARVSGTSQDLEGQIAELKEKGHCTTIYSEKFTGTSKDRKEFQRLIGKLEAGDTLTVTKLDRFARTAEDGISLIKELMRKGVRVHIINMGIVEDTKYGRLMLTILSGFAEFERDMIVERLAEGKAVAKLNPNFKEGRPKKFTKKQIDHAMKLLETESFTEVENITGISRSTLTRAKRSLKRTEIIYDRR
ncbi:resolvase [Sporosarcina sp. P37]|uniref:recombinase family protein n=1 Tax=unclassified Sporosarcina TaxID=2647733 RepID=UPI000A17EB58|nr:MULTISPECIES: recombinase family protein [unclassified Sporosarcina]ARK24156.1 resolvase [Sporosarcina sp. P37]PID17425.1 resolvase [Sporosarcina sp. P35]